MRSRPGPRRLVVRAGVVRMQAVVRLLATAIVAVVLVVQGGDGPSAAATVVPLLAALWIAASAVVVWPRSADRRRGSAPRDPTTGLVAPPSPTTGLVAPPVPATGLVAPRSPTTGLVPAILDVVAVCAVAASVAEPRGAVLLALAAVPLAHGMTLRPPAVAALTGAGAVGGLAVWASTSLLGTAEIGGESLALVLLGILWAGLVAWLVAVERERRADRIAGLSASVRDLLLQALRAEAHERGRIADLLHDDVLQALLTSRHDIADAMDGDLDLLPEAHAGLDAATRRLRETIVALRDEGTDDGSLGGGLHGLADDPGRRRGVAVAVTVEDRLRDVQHPILVGAARDLLRDAEASSGATTIEIGATFADDAVALVVSHDDRRHALGLDPVPGSTETIAAVAARIHALDGTMDVARDTDGGRRIVIRVPVPGDRRGAATGRPRMAGAGPRRPARTR